MKIVAILDTMWNWQACRAGRQEADRSFRISPDNHSGKRLYRIVGVDADLHVTNACRELGTHANHHGTPDPHWLFENLEMLEPFDVLLVCGKVAQAAYERSGYGFHRTIEMMHPASRTWTQALIAATAAQVQALGAVS